MHITSIGIDLGKTTFHLVALDDRGKVVIKRSSRVSNYSPTPPTCRLHCLVSKPVRQKT